MATCPSRKWVSRPDTRHHLNFLSKLKENRSLIGCAGRGDILTTSARSRRRHHLPVAFLSTEYANCTTSVIFVAEERVRSALVILVCGRNTSSTTKKPRPRFGAHVESLCRMQTAIHREDHYVHRSLAKYAPVRQIENVQFSVREATSSASNAFLPDPTSLRCIPFFVTVWGSFILLHLLLAIFFFSSLLSSTTATPYQTRGWATSRYPTVRGEPKESPRVMLRRPNVRQTRTQGRGDEKC